MGIGYVNGPYKTYAHTPTGKRPGKDAYYYRVNGYKGVVHVVKLLWPWLSPVKRAQAKKVLKAYKEVH